MSILKSMIDEAARARRVLLDSFTYVANWVNLGALGQVQVNIPISADSDFLWMESSGTVMTAANVLDPAPDMTLQFTDTGSGRNLQDNPVHWLTVVGNGAWPYILPEPKLLIGNGALAITLTDLANVAKARIHLSLIGVKVFYIKGYDRGQLLGGI